MKDKLLNILKIIKDKVISFRYSLQFKSITSSLITILISIFIGFILMLILNPSNSIEGLSILLTYGFEDFDKVIRIATPIIFTGLSVAFAFKTGLFNIGATGQFTMGAVTAVYIGINWTFLPYPIHWLVAIICAVFIGALWGLIPGLLKAFRNVHEVVATIMMNYIAMYITVYLVKTDKMLNSMIGESKKVALTASNLSIGDTDIAFFIAIIVAVITFIFLFKTKKGFELRAVGSNKDAAHYAGINEKISMSLSMGVAGGLAALGGALMYLSLNPTYHLEPLKVLLPQGFDGISVALIASSNPLAVVFSGLFIGFLRVGGEELQGISLSTEFVDIIIATIIYFVAFSKLLQDKVFDKDGKFNLFKKIFRKNKDIVKEDE